MLTVLGDRQLAALGWQAHGRHTPAEQLSIAPQACVLWLSPSAAQARTMLPATHSRTPGVHTQIGRAHV